MTVIPNGPMSMARPLVQWFICIVVVSVLAAYLAGATLAADATYLAVFRVAGTTAFIAYAAGCLAAIDLVPPSLVDDAEAHARRPDLRAADRRGVRLALVIAG